MPQFSQLASQHIFKLFTDSEVDEKVSAGIDHNEELAESEEYEVPFRNLGTTVFVQLKLVSKLYGNRFLTDYLLFMLQTVTILFS